METPGGGVIAHTTNMVVLERSRADGLLVVVTLECYCETIPSNVTGVGP